MMEQMLQEEKEELRVPDEETVKSELQLDEIASISISPGEHPDLDAQAEEVTQKLVSLDVTDVDARERSRASVDQMGLELQKEAMRQSEMLEEPVRKLADKSEDGGEVASALIDLKTQVESLDPARFDFEPGWFSRLLGYLPGVGTPAKRYFSKYESAQSVIDAIIKSLELGREQLKRDNITLLEDQRRMRELAGKLQRAIQLGQLIDQKLSYKLERELSSEEEKRSFVEQELLFPLRQRIMDLQQQLAVNQQGILATEIVVRNNKELMRGVNRALNVTVSALQIAVTVAMALSHQKIVLDKITALNTTTSNLIANTAERLKTQGTEIHKQASSAMLDLEALKKAFADINAAMADIGKFRAESLPKMAKAISEMDELASQAHKKIVEKDMGRKVEPIIPIEVG
jgi:uncharacterized protein YaaN involved in tellurite resistance